MTTDSELPDPNHVTEDLNQKRAARGVAAVRADMDDLLWEPPHTDRDAHVLTAASDTIGDILHWLTSQGMTLLEIEETIDRAREYHAFELTNPDE